MNRHTNFYIVREVQALDEASSQQNGSHQLQKKTGTINFNSEINLFLRFKKHILSAISFFLVLSTRDVKEFSGISISPVSPSSYSVKPSTLR